MRIVLPSLIFSLGMLGYTASQENTWSVSQGEWPAYGRDPGGTRFAPLDQINRDNVRQLEVAWMFRTGELATYEGTRAASKAAFEATPIMVDGTLYFSTPSNRVFAIDADSGSEKWAYDPQVDVSAGYSEFTSRGVSTWVDPDRAAGQPLHRRIFVGTIDGCLIALDAASGQPVEAFGDNGQVDLRKGVGRIQVTSPPAIVDNVLVIGSAIGDNNRFDHEPGVVRAFDTRSGRLIWQWDPIPRKKDDPGWDTWQGEQAHRTGAANAWAPISADPELGLVFIPTSSPSPDYYGGERLGDNLYANSIVATHARTGEIAWHFQTVHHDLWDYDIPAQPVLIEVDRDGQRVPAVAVATKIGHTFVFHRETGEPLFPIEERPVPQTDVPGEKTSPTQPFPLKPPSLGLRKLTPDDAWGVTPDDRAKGREMIEALRYDGVFTPPSLRGSVMAPSNVGGMNWGGMAYDPTRNLLVGPVNRIGAVVTLIPREGVEEARSQLGRMGSELGPQHGTPYAMKREYLFDADQQGLHVYTPPPWGTLAAMDMNSGELKWEVPLGIMFDPDTYPDAPKWGSISLGGAMITAGGLVFVAATMDSNLRAFDIETGALLWMAPLPAGGQATPMSFQTSEDGKQYLVVAAGGHGKIGTQLGDYVVAFALPDN